MHLSRWILRDSHLGCREARLSHRRARVMRLTQPDRIVACGLELLQTPASSRRLRRTVPRRAGL